MDTQFRIANSSAGVWAKSFRSPAPIVPIIWDPNYAGPFERWNVQPFQDGYSIRNIGSGFWICARGDEVIASSGFDPVACKWSIERAGGNQFIIKLPNQDLVWTLEEGRATIRPADGTPEQRFELTPALQD